MDIREQNLLSLKQMTPPSMEEPPAELLQSPPPMLSRNGTLDVASEGTTQEMTVNTVQRRRSSDSVADDATREERTENLRFKIYCPEENITPVNKMQVGMITTTTTAEPPIQETKEALVIKKEMIEVQDIAEDVPNDDEEDDDDDDDDEKGLVIEEEKFSPALRTAPQTSTITTTTTPQIKQNNSPPLLSSALSSLLSPNAVVPMASTLQVDSPMVAAAPLSVPVPSLPVPSQPPPLLAPPSASSSSSSMRKVYQCSTCATYFEDWSLFLHMQNVHNRFICLLCFGLFPTAQKLARHLNSRHSLPDRQFKSPADLLKWHHHCYLMCVHCEQIFQATTTIPDPDYLPPLDHHRCTHNNNNSANNNTLNSSVSGGSIVRNRTTKRTAKAHNNQSLEATRTTTTLVNSAAVMPLVPPLTISRVPVQPEMPPPEPSPPTLSTLKTEAVMNSNSGTQELPVQEQKEEKPKEDAFRFKFILSKNGLISKRPPTSCPSPSAIPQNQPTELVNGTRGQESVPERDPPFLSKITLKIPKNILPVESEEEDDDEDDDGEDDDDGEEEEDDEDANGDQEDDEDDNDYDEDAAKSDEDDEGAGNDEGTLAAADKTTATIAANIDPQSNAEHFERPCGTPVPEGQDTGNGMERPVDAVGDTDETIKDAGGGSDQADISLKSAKPKEEAKPESVDDKGAEPENPIAMAPNPADPNEVKEADNNSQLFELSLDQPLDQIPLKDFLRTCLKQTIPFCLYCYHARRIAVNGKNLAIHMVLMHRFSATVDSITAEELMPETIVSRLRSTWHDLKDVYFNLEDYDSEVVAPQRMKPKIFECFQCRFTAGTHKELYLHNRKLHMKTVLLCLMCKSTFYNYSDLLCHICPGMASRELNYDLTYRCHYCSVTNLSSAFRLMVHLRKCHAICEVCLEECFDQTRLSNHAWKHKLHHFCYRCGIAYRNKPDITKHLFWKHGTESVLCKKCLQKRWPHIYHFCLPPATFTCEQCALTFSRAVHLRVHKRLHADQYPHECQEEACGKSFISRRILEKHIRTHQGLPMEGEAERKLQEAEAERNANGLNVEKEEIIGQEEGGEREDVAEPPAKLDLIDRLRVPNLSESDSSSDESGSEDATTTTTTAARTPPKFDDHSTMTGSSEFRETGLPTIKEEGVTVKEEPVDEVVEAAADETKTKTIIDIWENFKSYQATQIQNQQQKSYRLGYSDDEEEEDLIAPLPPPILHVLQSDHDYACMYKASNTEEDWREIQDIETMRKYGQRYTSSSSSGSDSSSCSCGSNCSCSSSDPDTNSTLSSSSSDINETGSQKALRKSKKKADKANKNNPLVTIQDVNVLPETDLETSESETDEEFYDPNPYKKAQLMIAEKNKQQLNESLSRSSTPALPGGEDVTATMSRKERKKMKKLRKRAKKSRREQSSRDQGGVGLLVPPLKLNVPPLRIKMESIDNGMMRVEASPSSTGGRLTPQSAPAVYSHNSSYADSSGILEAHLMQMQSLHHSTSGAGGAYHQASTLSQSTRNDDPSLKRSKRRRIPNRFYGYSSDEENGQHQHYHPHMLNNSSSSGGYFRPTPPPHLTWRKEDLPSPASTSSAPAAAAMSPLPHSKSIIVSPNNSNFNYNVGMIDDSNLINNDKSMMSSMMMSHTMNETGGTNQKNIGTNSSCSSSSDRHKENALAMRSASMTDDNKTRRRKKWREDVVNSSVSIPNKFDGVITNNSDSNYHKSSHSHKQSKTSNHSSQSLLKSKANKQSSFPNNNRINNYNHGLHRHSGPASSTSSSSFTTSAEAAASRAAAAVYGDRINNAVGAFEENEKLVDNTSSSSGSDGADAAAAEEETRSPAAKRRLNTQLAAHVQHHVQQYSHAEPAIPRLKIRQNGVIVQEQLPQQLQQHQQHYNNLQQSTSAHAIESSNTNSSAAEDNKLYCYCRRPYVETDAEMIACDDEACHIEWFHFACVGILMAPQGTWYCPDCTTKRMAGGRRPVGGSSGAPAAAARSSNWRPEWA